MIKIFTSSDKINDIKNTIATQDRMHELVSTVDFLNEKITQSGHSIIVNNEGIMLPIDWYNTKPPYILQQHIWYTDENILGMIYFALGNFSSAISFFEQNPSLQSEIKIIEDLTKGIVLNPDMLSVETYKEYDDYRLMHNHAIVRHYDNVNMQSQIDKIHYYYNAAMDAAPSHEHQAFSAKHYMNFLFDINEKFLAEKIGSDALKLDISKDAKAEINNTLCQIWISDLTVPYDQDRLQIIKDTLWTTLQQYEAQDRQVEAAMLYDSAAHIANISESFAEALGYISKAIKIFEEEGIEEFYFNAVYKKGTLLYTWAKNGNPQFFRAAGEAYQEAMKYFKKEDYAYIFADIQHHLGVIYSEIPDEVKKKSIWAAVSSSSFLESLSIYDKESYPYEYALVCNAYANALTHYPQAIHSDNYEKALYFYNEALNIRTASQYPMERAMTLLNFIETSWYADNSANEANKERFEDMWNKSEEVLALEVDEKFKDEANIHLDKLKELRVNLSA